MNWKISLLILIELCFVLFPANLIGCSDPADPFDEYIMFFRNDVAPARGYSPFYYIEDEVLYDPLAPAADTTDYVTKMWVRYCNGAIRPKDANRLVNKSTTKDLADLYAHFEKPSTALPKTLRDNPMTMYLLRKKDSAAAKYLWLAKQAEEYTSTGGNGQEDDGVWVIRREDSIGMAKLIAVALQERASSKNDFFRARYGFQAERLAFYDRHYEDCIHFYDQLVKGKPACGKLTSVGLGYKAGALWHTGRRREGAYWYSRLFTANPNPSDYHSFSWCVKRFEDSDRRACLAQCRNAPEKAEMLGLFLLGSNAPEKTALEQLYKLAPGTPVQEVLAVREVNKIERNYLTPHLLHAKGGRALNELFWYDGDDLGDNWLKEGRRLIPFYDSIARNSKVLHPGLFLTVAAQLCYIAREYGRGDSLLDRAGVLPATEKLRDQQKFTRLLLTINEKAVIDPDFEKALLPSLQWLGRKAYRDSVLKKPWELGDDHLGLWRQIYRNLLSEVLAKRYYRQKDQCSEALCIGAAEQGGAAGQGGVAEQGSAGEQGGAAGDATRDYVRDRMTTPGLITLLKLLKGSATTSWKKYLVSQFPVTVDEVKQAISVAYVREHHFHQALRWMKTIKDPALLGLNVNPFADLLFDAQDSIFAFDKGDFDKRTFITTMAALSDKVNSHTATAGDLYQLATGYYNMTYYGRAWETVRYDRTGEQAEDMPRDLTAFDKDYYGCYTAEAFFKKALEKAKATATATPKDRNFQARCLFMMAKCAQKQVTYVADYDIGYDNFLSRFKHNKYFPQLVADYANTPFYQEAFNTCSYLRDFVKKK